MNFLRYYWDQYFSNQFEGELASSGPFSKFDVFDIDY